MANLVVRVEEHGERLARHDAEIASLHASTQRLEAAMTALRAELHDTESTLRAEIVRGFDRVEGSITRLSGETLSAYTPQAVQQIGDTRAAEARARAWTISLLTAFVAAIGVIAALLTTRR